MQELFKKDMIYKVTAILLSLVLWFYVTTLQNPVIEKTITGVTVNYTGLKEGLVMGEHSQAVDVKVKGPNSSVNLLTAKDIKVNVDLTQAKMGESSLPLDQDQVTVPAGVEVINTKPQSIHVFVDAIKEKQLPVKVEYLNAVTQGYTSYEPVVTPSIVVVRGATQLLANLEVARITVDLNKATANLVLSLPVQLLAKEDKPASHTNLEISPDKLQVFVPVVENTPTKTVIIKPILIGKPKDGFVVSRTVVEPETMKITGPADKIERIDQIITRPIDISGLQENMIIQASLETPEGVNLLYQPTAKVMVQIEEAPVTKTFTGIAITMENQPVGLKTVLNKDKVDVTVKGPRDEMAKLVESDIHALVDLNGLKEGTHKQEVKIALPINVQVVKVESSTVDIVISL